MSGWLCLAVAAAVAALVAVALCSIARRARRASAEYERRLSPVERLWLVADRLHGPFVNQLVLEGEGTLDPDIWRAAVAAAAVANPGARLVLRGHLTASRLRATVTPPPIRVVNGAAWDGRCEAGAPFMETPLAPRTGPTVEVLLVEGTPPRVIVRTHHAVMDGRGTLSFVEDLFRALNGAPPIGATSPVTDVALARSLQAARAERRIEDCLAPTGRAVTTETRGTRWRRVTVPGKHSRLLPRVALAVAEQARLQAGEDGADGRVRFDLPVDLRPRAPGLRSTANLTGMLHLEVPPEATALEIAQKIETMRRDGLETAFGPGLGVLRALPLGLMARVGRAAIARVHRRGRYLASGVLSNIGRLPLEQFRGGGFRATAGFFVPPGVESTPLFLALTGSKTEVQLVATMPRPLADSGRLEELLAAIAGKLAEGH